MWNFQGLILGATALSSIPYLTDNLGLPYELAWSCVIIEVFMYMLHGWLGDPVVPGWITPTLPFTLAYLNGFEKGPDRIQAMIALQLLVAFVFIFMGITKLADKFVNGVPNSGTIIGWKPAYDCTGSNTRRYIIARIFKLFTILRKEQK